MVRQIQELHLKCTAFGAYQENEETVFNLLYIVFFKQMQIATGSCNAGLMDFFRPALAFLTYRNIK